MSKPRKTARTSQELNQSVGSAVARAAIKRSGAGAHGGNKSQQNRRERARTRKLLRQGFDY